MKPGDRVRVWLPDNTELHGAVSDLWPGRVTVAVDPVDGNQGPSYRTFPTGWCDVTEEAAAVPA